MGRTGQRRARRIHPPGRPPLRQRRSAAIYWGMGISQIHPRHRQHPLPGQPGPDVRPRRQSRYRSQSPARPEQRPGLLRQRRPAQRLHRLPKCRRPTFGANFEQYWGVALNPQPGLTATEMVDGAVSGAVTRHVHRRRKPDDERAEPEHTRHALEQLELLVCQDIFINETGEWPTSFCPPSASPKKTAPSPTPTAACQRVRGRRTGRPIPRRLGHYLRFRPPH
jgi:formate dehydrogenase major subunit